MSKRLKIGAEHVSHCIGIGFDFRPGSPCLGKAAANGAERREDEIARQLAGRSGRPWQGFHHEGIDHPVAFGAGSARLRAVAIERGRVIERTANLGLFALGAKEGGPPLGSVERSITGAV